MITPLAIFCAAVAGGMVGAGIVFWFHERLFLPARHRQLLQEVEYHRMKNRQLLAQLPALADIAKRT